MREVWLKTNTRPLLLGLILSLLFDAGGVLLLALGLVFQWGMPMVVLGGILSGLGTMSLLVHVVRLQTPRLAREGDQLLVFFDSLQPVKVPLQIVECFFLGQGPSLLPSPDGGEIESQNVIVRLAEAAQEWRHKETNPKFGHWCDSYITLRGAWCEPISEPALKRLNEKLIAAHREQKELAKVNAGARA